MRDEDRDVGGRHCVRSEFRIPEPEPYRPWQPMSAEEAARAEVGLAAARMRERAQRRHREAAHYPDDEQTLAEQAAVTEALMPVQMEAMRDAENAR